LELPSLVAHWSLLAGEPGPGLSMVAHQTYLATEGLEEPEAAWGDQQPLSSMVAHQLVPEAWSSMVAHQLVQPEGEGPFPSLASHWLLPPALQEEGGPGTSLVAHQHQHQPSRSEQELVQELVRLSRARLEVEEVVVSAAQLAVIQEEEPTSGLLAPSEVYSVSFTGGRWRAEDGQKETGREYTRDPRRASIESVSVLSFEGITSPVGTEENVHDSFDEFIDASKKTHHQVSDEYKSSMSTIKRIQELHKLVEEEIDEFEKSRNDAKKSRVISNVKGVSFPLEITIDQQGPKEEPIFTIEDIQEYEEEVGEKDLDEDSLSIESEVISGACILRENSPVVIKTNVDHFETDSGFEGSPDTRSKILPEALYSIPFHRQATPKRNSEEQKTRDKELLESFLKNENHQIKRETPVTSSPQRRMTPEKKQIPDTPSMPEIPLPLARSNTLGQKKLKAKKPKLTTAAFKESIMRKTYKIRFHVNLNKAEQGEKPGSVLNSFLNFFKGHTFFGKK
jgi:hypothetical protein